MFLYVKLKYDKEESNKHEFFLFGNINLLVYD